MKANPTPKPRPVKSFKAWMISAYGGPVTIDERLPIYWLRRPAQNELGQWRGKCRLVRVEVKEVQR